MPILNNMSRRAFFGTAGLAGMALLAGCAGNSSASTGSGSASGSQSGAKGSLTVGTLATEDILPLWVAEKEGMFSEDGLDVSIVTFQSATELIAGVASNEVDIAMTDIMVTASMYASGIDVQMQWVTLGSTADQGRFGIMVGPDSDINSLEKLAGVPIGVGSNTILEYVMDKLMEGAGVPDDQIVVEELQKLPVRYQAMVSGEVAAAALPGTLLALGESDNCKLIADDTMGDNLSQSVMIARAEVLADSEKAKALNAVRGVWDKAAEKINANPEQYRDVLVTNANLPEAIAGTYPISTYPLAMLPTSTMVEPVLDWMQSKGYLTKQLGYDETTGAFIA